MATSNGISPTRIPETLQLVGLSDVADRRVGTFSLGMGQRLGIAAALLGDPEVVILDEPMNGLDPEGIRWIRDLARSLAGSGRTVLISSHLMGEMQSMADDLVVMARGTVIRAGAATSLVADYDSLEHAYFAWTQGRAEHVAGGAA
jgi:ABC-2 type transport system ATP-binding protein